MNDSLAPQRRNHWYPITGLLLGLGFGLLYAWKISPVRYVDTDPSALRADFKDQYRLTIASAYLATGNLERARARLALLGEENPIEALGNQAQRRLAQGDPQGESRALLALATALREAQTIKNVSPTTTTEAASAGAPGAIVPFTPTSSASALPTVTPTLIQTQTPARVGTLPASPTPRPTRTPTPTIGPPFRLVEHATVCDPSLPEGLLQIEARDSRGKPLVGVEIVITWRGGEEHFFTGLKPELGHGYADYRMTPDILYTLQLMPTSTLVTDLSAPLCHNQGEEYWGGLRLLFAQQ